MNGIVPRRFHSHSCAKAHEKVLKVSPRGHAHGLSVRTWIVRQALYKLPVTLTELVAAASTTRGLGLASNAVRSSSVTLPLVGDKVWQVVLQDHAGGGGVAPVMHLAAPVNTIHGVTRPKEPAVAAIAFVYQGVASSPALYHRIEIPGSSLARVVEGNQDFIEDWVREYFGLSWFR